ncbi:SGNH/GDSL hydrolase family protein [Arthrobacter sp. Br18]|uniref:SGNH/GDSL hydrolase family protein n=1 Tax=Arthrobacter sp. Br18 TaxID=1312954 RepID=UPI00138AE86E|nr:SGNH/GDSL hydrolase family protein [Arthrobacter sp. Br18]
MVQGSGLVLLGSIGFRIWGITLPSSQKSTLRTFVSKRLNPIAATCFGLGVLLGITGLYLNQQDVLQANAEAARAYRSSPVSPPTVAPTESPEPTIGSVAAGSQALFIGDAFTEGYGTTTPSEEGFARVLSRAREWNAVVDGIGSTGFTFGSDMDGSDGNEYQARISKHADNATLNPAIVVLQGGLDDTSTLSVPTINAISATVETATAAWPDARIVVIGPVAPYPASETLLEGTAVTRTGATVAGAEFIDPAPWFTPENSEGYDSGDGYHLTTAPKRGPLRG